MTIFHFQQFSVLQQRSGMKVCTDSVLFGAMAPVQRGARVLDIGAGTGVLSLMAAQLGAAEVTAVELTDVAIEEARTNFNNSPWPERFRAVHQDIQSFALSNDRQYDLIVSNPPFFDQHYKTADVLRNIARHTDQLPFSDLVAAAKRLLCPHGLFYLLIPTHAVEIFCTQTSASGFYLHNRTDIRGFTHNKAKVSALTFGLIPAPFASRTLTVYAAANVYSPDSETYLKNFLLRFAKK
ncbi:MAG: tRNA1(Val) (adenine(37)-N6)-methyltransferase [Methylobacter sp.]